MVNRWQEYDTVIHRYVRHKWGDGSHQSLPEQFHAPEQRGFPYLRET
jgi:hypothetical protein